mgnify:CR=1 FL=1
MSKPTPVVTDFTQAAGRLGEFLLRDLATRDAELAAKVAEAVAHGAQLSLSFYSSGPTRVEMAVTDDYGTRHLVSSISLAEVRKH